ncbi:hypothetical protein GCM10010528_22680 [Gordonia defluvii]|uniref:Uncharacterized protein n=1 Tax=Gordonia defluvii TaxID=283718 RepID=A0ABP6LGJ9_9ACTN|nr:hypothetical protein [Gordonia sp. UBA5067]
MKSIRILTLAMILPLVALGLSACDRVVFGDPEADPNARVTVTTTVSPDTPTTTGETPTPTTPPRTTAIPPDGPAAYHAVDPSRFLLAPPTPVATYAFSVPSGNIACFAGSEFICEIHDGPNQSAAQSRCGFYGDNAEEHVRIAGWFKYDRAPCSTILQGVWRDPGPALNYGESVRLSVPGAEFNCYSSIEALYCTGPQNYGFKLSRTEFIRSPLS